MHGVMRNVERFDDAIRPGIVIGLAFGVRRIANPAVAHLTPIRPFLIDLAAESDKAWGELGHALI
jgi:hypothetical protein